MEWKRDVTVALLVVIATAAWASTKEIAQELLDSQIKSLQDHRRAVHLLKNMLNELDTNMEAVHRCSNIGGDNCGNGYLPGAGDDNDWMNGGGGPGKRCSNVGGDNCGTGYLPGAADDNEWLTGGSTPGKRSFLNELSPQEVRLAWIAVPSNDGPEKRCSNVGGDNCGTGYLPGAATDNNWLSGGGGPGKRSLSSAKFRAWLRCSNVGGDNCGTGYLPGAGDDNDWMNGGGGPGKRSLSKSTLQKFCEQYPMSVLCRNL